MNPYKLKNVFEYLTSNNQLLKKKLKLGTDEIPIPPKKQNVIDIEAINRFNQANPRVETTNLKPLSVKHSNVKQSNVGQADEGVIQGAFDTATREAQSEGFPAPKYDAFKKKILEKNMKADGGRIGYNIGSVPGEQGSMGPVYTTNKIEDAAKEVVKRLIRLDGVDIPLTDKISMSLGPDLDQTEIHGVMDILGGTLNFGGGMKGEDKGIGFTFRKEFQDGGMLVQPSDDGSRPGYKSERVYNSPDVDTFSDALLDAYAKDDITKIVESGKSTKFANVITAIESGKDKSAKLAKVIKNTGLDEETIFNLLDDRKAYIDLAREGGPAGANPRAGNFYRKAENWITTNSKRYADPDKFKKAFIRTFGTNNDLIKTMKKLNVPGARKQTSVPFSSWFKETILGSTKGSDAGYNFNQLNNIFKTSIYTNNETVRNKLTKEINRILSIPLEKGGKFDIRNEIKSSPLFKKFGFDKQIRGPIARLLANEIGQELLDQVSSFRDPYLGTTELIRFLKNNVDPKYKSMFEEAAKAADLAAKNKWPEAKQILKIKDNIMFDHKIPKELVKLGYADELEYIKLNPTSAEFNTRIKNPEFDQKIIKLAKDFERTTSLDGKAKVVEKMNILKNNFSKKYGGYLDEVSIVPDKTGKPIFKSSAAPVTKQTDFVSSLGKSMVQAGEITQKKANILSAFCNRKGFKLAGSVEGLTCSMEEIQTNMQKQIDEAAKVSKDGKIPKKFGKLKAFAGSFFGDVAIPLEYMFAAPYLAAGDIEGAKRATTAGLFGYGKVDLDKLPEGEGQRFLKHINALNSFMDNYQSKAMAENELENASDDESRFILTNRISEAAKNMRDISLDYQTYGYDGQKGLLQGKVAAQQLIRDQVQSDYDKKINKSLNTEFFKDSNKQLLESNIRYGDKENDPNQVTPITDLESYIRNKGEATAGNTNLFFDVKPYTLNRAEAYGVPDIFDQYAGGYAGVETPGFIRETGEVDMGTKDVRDAYSSLPINMASQLAALEKEEFDKGMKEYNQNKVLKNTLPFASGGIASLTDTIPPESGPTPHGLRYPYNNVKKI